MTEPVLCSSPAAWLKTAGSDKQSQSPDGDRALTLADAVFFVEQLAV